MPYPTLNEPYHPINDPYQVVAQPTLDSMFVELRARIWDKYPPNRYDEERIRRLFFEAYGFFLQSEFAFQAMGKIDGSMAKEKLMHEFLMYLKKTYGPKPPRRKKQAGNESIAGKPGSLSPPKTTGNGLASANKISQNPAGAATPD